MVRNTNSGYPDEDAVTTLIVAEQRKTSGWWATAEQGNLFSRI